jgi:predicted aldo/keto reductase-like oxidoreductase
MGTSWALSPSFAQLALAAGIRYIDSSESYEQGNSERVLGEVLERTKLRKDVYLVTKCNSYKRGNGADPAAFAQRLNGSLERLRTDYVDAYYIHGIEGKSLGMLRDPAVKKAFEDLKKAGKIRFCGLSCHDAMLPELLDAAADAGWLDQVMIQYNFRVVDHDKLQRAVDKASKANIGLVAMKTQKGAESFPKKIAELTEKGFKKEVAALKAVWADDRMQVVVSEMTNRNNLRENVAASNDPLSPKEARLLEEHRQQTANMYCHGCGHLCETAARGVPVATVLRYLRYYSAYGKREQARALYQALPPAARSLADADLAAAERACPHGLPVVDLVQIAHKHLS